jgi:hypothetical protein
MIYNDVSLQKDHLLIDLVGSMDGPGQPIRIGIIMASIGGENFQRVGELTVCPNCVLGDLYGREQAGELFQLFK